MSSYLSTKSQQILEWIAVHVHYMYGIYTFDYIIDCKIGFCLSLIIYSIYNCKRYTDIYTVDHFKNNRTSQVH